MGHSAATWLDFPPQRGTGVRLVGGGGVNLNITRGSVLRMPTILRPTNYIVHAYVLIFKHRFLYSIGLNQNRL